MKKIDSILDVLFWAADQAHLWHLQTKSKTAHGILKDFYEEVREDMDDIAECYMGETGKALSIKQGPKLSNLESDVEIVGLMEKTCGYLRDVAKEMSGTSTARCAEDLIDDIVAIKYKLRFLDDAPSPAVEKKEEKEEKTEKPQSKSYIDKLLNRA